VQIDVVQASDSREIEVAFATLVRNRADALVIGPDAFFTSRRLQSILRRNASRGLLLPAPLPGEVNE